MDLPIGIFLIIVGLVVLYLDIFKWGWFSENQHRKPISMYDWIEDKWGEKGVRITIGIIAGLVAFAAEMVSLGM